VAVSNGVADASFTVDGTNTTIYIINTDATDLGDNNTNDTILNFTTMANVSAFLTNAVKISNVAGQIHYFIIRDGITLISSCLNGNRLFIWDYIKG